MDDPNITREEYIRLEEEKAHRRGKEYNWETAIPQHFDEFDLKINTISNNDEEEQNVLYFNDLFPFNITYPDDLKSDKDNDLAAPHSPEYVPDSIELEDHVPVYIPEPKHPKDLVSAEDEAPTPPLPPFFLSPRIRPPRTRASWAQMRDYSSPPTYHPILPSGTHIKDRVAVRAEIEVLRRERLAYEQERYDTRSGLGLRTSGLQIDLALNISSRYPGHWSGARVEHLDDNGCSSRDLVMIVVLEVSMLYSLLSITGVVLQWALKQKHDELGMAYYSMVQRPQASTSCSRMLLLGISEMQTFGL
ncbi:hypothetical protein Tco_0153363 [Tanacetum coccineum]